MATRNGNMRTNGTKLTVMTVQNKKFATKKLGNSQHYQELHMQLIKMKPIVGISSMQILQQLI